ncbi:hypothetical protein DITRI_Ditri18aG0039800 [Diplodiscus trichospermus]
MAFFLKNSRNIINNLKSKVGFLRLMKQSGDCCYCSYLNNINHCHFLPLTTNSPFVKQLKNPDSNTPKNSPFLVFKRFESTTAEKPITSVPNDEGNQVLDFPGGNVIFSPEMRFISESPSVHTHCYRVLDDNGQLIRHDNFIHVSEEIAVKMYSNMVTLQILDTIFYEAQRQGRISFYLTTMGEEAINIASAAALTLDDFVFPQGDFHAALNFAAVTEAPVIFICRNNGWAISTPTSDQFRSEGIAVRGQAYGVQSIRVDGNDALAIYSAVHAARRMAVNEQRPILIEALTYRVGHHSTSDDSTKYRPADEIEWWRMARDPVTRFRKWIESNGWWSSEAESQLRSSTRNQLLHAIQLAEKVEKPPVKELFTDVYDDLPSNLREQEKLLRETFSRHPKDYPGDVPL